MAQAKKTGNTKKKTAASKKTAAKSSSGTAKKAASGQKAGKTDVRGEIVILAAVVLCILLFLGDLNLAGSLGGALRQVQLGLFGTLGYLFPFYLLWAAVFTYANGRKYPGNTVIKILVSFVTFISLCGLVELLAGRSFSSGGGYTLAWYYASAGQGLGGGWFGGLFYLWLYPVCGIVGTYVLLSAIVIIGIVFTTGRSLIRPLRERGSFMAERARKNSERRREEEALRREEEELREQEERMDREERRRQLEQRRTELKARSLAFGEETKLESADAGEEGAEQPGRKSGAEQPVPSSPEKEGKSAENKTEPEAGKRKVTAGDIEPSSRFTGTIHGSAGEEYVPRRETRTLAELEAGSPDRAEPADRDGTESPDRPDKDVEAEPGTESPDRVDISGWLGSEAEGGEAPVPISLDESGDEPGLSGEWERVFAEAESSAPEDFPESGLSAQDLPEEDFSEEESMAAYGDFDDSPVAGTWNGMPVSPASAAAGTVRRGRAGNGDIWRTGEKADGNSGVTFTAPAAVKPEETAVSREYRYPSLELLKAAPKKTAVDREKLEATAVKLQQTLRNFGVGVTVTDISCGPAVTRYELHPDQGVKVSRIVGLTDDIKLNLAAADIRIEAPIPGKAAVGIEVPNSENQTVYLRELLDSDEFRKSASKISFGVGKDIGGRVVVADLARMPHLLIAGATGSGKSVCINTMIMSILYKAHPDDVKLIMIDPKVVELSVYNGIPHLMIPVVTDPKKAAGALNWAVSEMTDRYRRFAEEGVRDIRSYNKKAETSGDEEMQKMPQIVVIVDELADLMMVAAGEVEEAICRLAQLARAAGIHLVLATQRPSVNVITGLIKANVPSRIAFATSSGVDSRTILDMNGAEKLLGKGDMLFYPSGYPKPVRVQGSFVSDSEVAAVVEFLTSNAGPGTGVNLSLEKEMEASAKDAGTVGAGSRDELFVQAGEYIIDKEKASIGNLQRVFRIGFNRAARLMDQLADYGVVGPDEGTKARQVLMTAEQFRELAESLGQTG